MKFSKQIFLLFFLLTMNGCASVQDSTSASQNYTPDNQEQAKEPGLFRNIEVWEKSTPRKSFEILLKGVRPELKRADNGQIIYPSYGAVRLFAVERAKELKAEAVIMVGDTNNLRPMDRNSRGGGQPRYTATIIKYNNE